MTKFKVSEIFIPGGLPRHTYINRVSSGLERQMEDVLDNLCKVATVTGNTKSGKTVLVRKCVGENQNVWIDGGYIKSVDDFWRICAGRIGVTYSDEESLSGETSHEIYGETAAEGGIGVAKLSGKAGAKKGGKKVKQQKKTTARHVPIEVENRFKATKTILIIDDFHYIKREIQAEITRIVKPWVFDGVPVIFIAIPHRRFDTVKVEREMNGRIKNIPVPNWDVSELMEIPNKGLPLLNIIPVSTVSQYLADEANGSPHLMQEFCKQICYRSDIRETVDVRVLLRNTLQFDYTSIFKDVASELGKNIYDKLAGGPRQRSDRKQRKLIDGRHVDIYRVVIYALAKLQPGVSTVEYETIRSSIREILDDDLPQAHEVSRVLEQMAKVSSLDESSVPVIDYEKQERKLHITDPFFAFFLKWGDTK